MEPCPVWIMCTVGDVEFISRTFHLVQPNRPIALPVPGRVMIPQGSQVSQIYSTKIFCLVKELHIILSYINVYFCNTFLLCTLTSDKKHALHLHQKNRHRLFPIHYCAFIGIFHMIKLLNTVHKALCCIFRSQKSVNIKPDGIF